MAVSWYVEKRLNETWLSLSGMFMDWIQANTELKNFGFSEGDEVIAESTTFACFRVPDRNAAHFELFETWAHTTDRVFGKAIDDTLNLSDGTFTKLQA